MRLRVAGARVLAAAACLLALASAHAPYYSTWSDYERHIIAQPLLRRGAVLFDGLLSDSGVLSPKWTPSNLGFVTDTTTGLAKLSIGPTVSPDADGVYGTLWYDDALPVNGTVIEFTFMWAGSSPSKQHDMNWWLASSVANNSAYATTGKTSPFYVWGLNGWGGARSGVERSDGLGSSTWRSPPQCSTPGKPHTVTHYALNGAQFLIVDGQLVGVHTDALGIAATHGYFALSAYQSEILVGRVTISALR